MAQDNKIYITGHINPHADSVAAAIAYAAYKKEQGFDAIPCVLGKINKESRYLLERFGFEEPMLLETAQVRLDEVDLDAPYSITPDNTIFETVHLMEKEKREGFAVVDEDKKVIGWVSKTDLAKIALSDTSYSHGMIRETSTENIAKTIGGRIIYDDENRHLNGKVGILTMTRKENLEDYDVADRIVITGGSKKAQKILIEKGAGMLIIIWEDSVEDSVLESVRAVNLDKVNKGLVENNIAGKNILISLGGTFEAIDPIRGISNRSSGKMGLELAKEAFKRGANVTILAAHHSVSIPKVLDVIDTESSVLMTQKVEELVPDFDVYIATAAVSDFTPISKEDSKISSSYNLSLEFEPIAKIIQKIKKINEDIFLVGFKAEYNISEERMIKCAQTQMKDAGTDLVVANDVSNEGCEFGSETN